jgi:hypothetical protein
LAVDNSAKRIASRRDKNSRRSQFDPIARLARTATDVTAPPSTPTTLYRIQAVARATRVSAHALRVWERRYQTLSSHRSPAGYRLYTDEDVARIRTIKELLDQGHPVGEVATLSMTDLERLRGRAR